MRDITPLEEVIKGQSAYERANIKASKQKYANNKAVDQLKI